MRSTRATSAVERLNRRIEAGAPRYSMMRTSSELFYLVQNNAGGAPIKLCEPMTLDDFDVFVNAHGPQTSKRVSKLDVAFEKQLAPRGASKAKDGESKD